MQNSNTPITKEGSATQKTVQDYLDTLLQDATQQALVEPQVQVENEDVEKPVAETVAQPTVAPVETVTESASTEIVEETLVDTEVTPEVTVSEPAIDAVTESTESVQDQTEVNSGDDLAKEWVNGRPAWAQDPFECLLFKVAGLTLAVPLTELGTVLNFQEELTPLFGQPDWFLGLLPSKTAGTVRVIDTAKKVMPEKYTEEARENLRYVILMKNSDWGLSCHEVAEAIKLTPDEVRWRSGRSQRPWLAGTVINHMCAIMDVSALVDLVNKDAELVKAPQWSRQIAE